MTRRTTLSQNNVTTRGVLVRQSKYQTDLHNSGQRFQITSRTLILWSQIQVGSRRKSHNLFPNLPSPVTPPPRQLPKHNHLPSLSCSPRPPSPMHKINHIPR